MTRHQYSTTVRWTGNLGDGTASYRGYSRAHDIAADGRPVLAASSDPAFRGEADRWNPELLFVAALSECHLLQYLHLCAVAGVVVTAYEDTAGGTLELTPDGGGAITEVVLRPVVTVADASMVERAVALHERAHELCFLASSVRMPVRHEPTVTAG
ncbi:OsmC family protein [Jiangella sp. DSM 45060]|uniref:OsmC family protein n=1 Tax=Jiangella sp. DSM 45060 TaxID=1798224 RepID=UPI00087AF1B1|nr:OsmC family protein [Jiangella sp. DSM 45060]SDT51117.1 Organic hydroperoxide reductase OsmC/OhrA [Jiangella sp. DSM 45060]